MAQSDAGGDFVDVLTAGTGRTAEDFSQFWRRSALVTFMGECYAGGVHCAIFKRQTEIRFDLLVSGARFAATA